MGLGIIIDGRMEQRIVQRLCSGVPVRLLGANGRDVAITAMAKLAAPQIRLLKHYSPILIIFDRESRVETSEQLEEQFILELAQCGIDEHQVIVISADRMIENWILACPEIRKKYELAESVEGANGKSILQKNLKKTGIVYHETTIGVELFCGIRCKEAANNSESFGRFSRAVSPYCPWLKKARAKPRAVSPGD